MEMLPARPGPFSDRQHGVAYGATNSCCLQECMSVDHTQATTDASWWILGASAGSWEYERLTFTQLMFIHLADASVQSDILLRQTIRCNTNKDENTTYESAFNCRERYEQKIAVQSMNLGHLSSPVITSCGNISTGSLKICSQNVN